MNRREYGSGGIYQRKDGLWIGTLEVGWTDRGTRRRATVSARTHAECKRRLRAKRAEVEENGPPTVSARATVKAWAEQCLEQAERTMRPSSYATARSAIRLWVVPAFGHKRVVNLTPGDVRAVSQAQRSAGRSSSTELRTHSVLVSMLKAAMMEGHPVHPRVLGVKPATKVISDRDAMTIEQALALLPWAAELHHGSRFLAALLQGMRQGKCLGLTWDQVDLEAGTITVSWQLRPIPYRRSRDRSSGFRVPDGYEARQLHGSLHLVRPESRAGFRVIPIVPMMREALATWREVQVSLLDENPHGLVWPNLDGRPTSSKLDDEEWYGLQQAAGVHHPTGRFFGLHEARHTTATLLLEAGVDPAVVVAIMGHSSILTTRGYQHVRTERALEALGMVADRLQLAS